MFFNKQSFGSVLFLAVLQPSTVIFVNASPFTKGGKKSKKQKREKCPSSGKQANKGASILDASILAKYNEFPNFSLTGGGIFTALDPPIDDQILFETNFKTFFDASCPESAKLICLKDCETTPDCTAISSRFNFNGNFSLCNLYNGDIQDAPIFQLPVNGEDLNISTLSTYFTLKDKPPIPLFEPSFFVPPGASDAFPNGSPDFIEYFLQGSICVGTYGLTTGFDQTLVDDCNACILRFLTEDITTGCNGIARAICNGEVAEECIEVCGPPACATLNQQAALLIAGQPALGVPDNGKGEEGIILGCITRNVFDPKLNDFIPPYTCPNNFIRPSILNQKRSKKQKSSSS